MPTRTISVKLPQNVKGGDLVRSKINGKTVVFRVPKGAKGLVSLKILSREARPPALRPFNPQEDPPELQNFRDSAFPNGDADVVRACIYSRLSFSDMVAVVWTTDDTIFSCDMAAIGPKLFKLMIESVQGAEALVEHHIENLSLSPQDLKTALKQPVITMMFKSINCPILIQLLDDSNIVYRSAFKSIDKDKDGVISYSEWMSFLSKIQKLRLEYMYRYFLVNDWAFAGLGMDSESADCCSRYFGVSCVDTKFNI